MRLHLGLILSLTAFVSARPFSKLSRRSLFGNTLSTGFAPTEISCPSGVEIRDSSTGLSSEETNYVNARLNQSAWQSYFSSLSMSASDFGLDLDTSIPNVAFAASGGGYRAMLNAGGTWQGTLNSESLATQAKTNINELLTYVAGLSGGSWFVTSIFANNGESPRDLLNGVWDLSSNLILPDYGVVDDLSFYHDLIDAVGDKKDENFPTAITDYWSLALGQHLLPYQYRLYNSSDNVQNTPNLTFSALVNGSQYTARALPYPIIVAAEREEGELIVPANATLWEFTTTEFGTFAFQGGGRGGGFAPIQYLGTSFKNGTPSSDSCYVGFDNAAFVAGTSSTLFNGAYLELNDTSVSGVIKTLVQDAIQGVLSAIGQDQNDVALYPNPFIGWHNSTNPTAALTDITLVDAGETDQNIPLEPLLNPVRKVDAILAIDSSADTDYSWPNGSAMVTTYNRLLSLSQKYSISLLMPPVPSTAAFVYQGLNTRPTFFGCSNLTNSMMDSAPNVTGSEPPPMVVYIPNYPWSYASNTSTYMLEYTADQTLGMIENGIRTLTLNNTVANWSTCLTCAMVDRTVLAQANNRTSTCQQCLDQWCWNGDMSEGGVAAGGKTYQPNVGELPAFIKNLQASS